MVFTINNNHISPILKEFPRNSNRQYNQTYHKFSGDLYIVDTKWILRNKKLITKDAYAYVQKNQFSIDIDTIEDFRIAEI